jgi:quinol monooxygenase YgiN
VIASIQCRPGCRGQFLQEFSKIIPDVRKEVGCIEYGPCVDVETDLPNQNRDEHRVTIVEKWESVSDLKAHLEASHMVSYRPRVKDFVLSSQLQIVESAEAGPPR